MEAFLTQWKAFTTSERRQYLIEIWALVLLAAFMFVVGFTFAGAASMPVFERIGGLFVARLLALACLICVLLAPLLLVQRQRWSVKKKQRAFIALMLPVIYYSVNIFLFARDTGNVGAGVIFYIFFFNILSVVAVTLYREA